MRICPNEPSGKSLEALALFTRKLNFVGMRVASVRHLHDGLELVGCRNAIRGFEIFILCTKGEGLARTVGSHRFNGYGRIPGHGARLLLLVIEEEPEARRKKGAEVWRQISFKESDFDKAMAQVQEETIVRSTFNISAFR